MVSETRQSDYEIYMQSLEEKDILDMLENCLAEPTLRLNYLPIARLALNLLHCNNTDMALFALKQGMKSPGGPSYMHEAVTKQMEISHRDGVPTTDFESVWTKTLAWYHNLDNPEY